MIDGFHDSHAVAGVGEEIKRSTNPFDHSRNIRNPLGLYLPLVVAADPIDDGGAIVGRLDGVAYDGVFQPLADGVEDEVGRREVHVGDPHRQQVVPSVFVPIHRKPLPKGVGLQCTAATTVYEGIKRKHR